MLVAVASRFKDKEAAIGPYQFHVVIENSQDNCYFTEKVFACCAHHCVLCSRMRGGKTYCALHARVDALDWCFGFLPAASLMAASMHSYWMQ